MTRDLTGQRFGRLVAIESFKKVFPCGKRTTGWRCRCDCGKETSLAYYSLIDKTNPTRSCGCLNVIEKKNRVSKFDAFDVAITKKLSSYTSNAESRNLSWELSRETFEELVTSYCYYCGLEPTSVTRVQRRNTGDIFIPLNGIDRKDSSKGYFIGNVVSACETCNVGKQTLNPSEFILWIKRVYQHISKFESTIAINNSEEKVLVS